MAGVGPSLDRRLHAGHRNAGAGRCRAGRVGPKVFKDGNLSPDHGVPARLARSTSNQTEYIRLSTYLTYLLTLVSTRHKKAMNIDGFALVTGAGSGIGRDCAMAYAIEGARGVAFADIDLDAAMAAMAESKAVAKNPSYDAISIAVNVTSQESVRQMVEQTVSRFGRIDYCVNSAGVSSTLGAASIAPASYRTYPVSSHCRRPPLIPVCRSGCKTRSPSRMCPRMNSSASSMSTSRARCCASER